ncbi:rho GTPase-activating protein 40 isoform X2 [Hypanus sabinus]|uniref:rho GTPase-activating protein 40 isoform X2 n=1 Tax=Hypanus sabinus TaxID=79690 RepID=UPI0028C40C14|nr:rho GTPase-activating protein 40 isoform X2 [Hypanus sabinus]
MDRKKSNFISKTYSRITRPKLYTDSMASATCNCSHPRYSRRSESSPSIMSHFQAHHFQDQLSSDCSSSQDSLDNQSLDDFWTEVENIKESCETEVDENSDVKTSDDAELDADWLKDTGLSTLINENSQDDDSIFLLSTLTRTQSAAVQRRVNSYTLSLRVKSKQPVRDVRDVFQGQKFSGSDSEHRNKHGSVLSPLQQDQQLEQMLPGDDKHEACSDEHGNSSPGQYELSKKEMLFSDVSYSEQAQILRNRMYFCKERKQKDDGTLPQFRIHKSKLGTTRMEDLSEQDMKKIRTLALIELTALFDVLDIEVKRNKATKVKTPENKLFGVPLTQLIENDQKIEPNTKVPLFLKELLCSLEDKGLETEGILRISGSLARIKTLQQDLESNFYQNNFDWKKVQQNDGASLLKTFIREMPCPLLTTEYVTAFATVGDITDQVQMIHSLNLLVLILPDVYRATLKVLLEFLRKVIKKEQRNKMNLWNVSTIIAPNLFMHKGMTNKAPNGNEKQHAEKAANVVRLLIHYQDLLWTVPCFLVAQVRKLNENSTKKYDKRIKNLLKKIHTDKHDRQLTELPYNKTIKVQAPNLLKGTLDIQLEPEMTIWDLLAQFRKKLDCDATSTNLTKRSNDSTECSEFCLYEVGGNIGERCLDPDINICELYKVNPHAEWIIRQCATFSKES